MVRAGHIVCIATAMDRILSVIPDRRFGVYEYVQMSQWRRIDDDTCTGTDSFAPVPVISQAATVCIRQMIAFKCIPWHKAYKN